MDKLSHGYFVVFTLAKINNIIEINKKNLVVCPFLCTFVGMKRMKREEVKLSELPEEVTKEGLKVYGTTSYETQVAVLSHYLHTLDGKHDIASGEKRYEILGIFNFKAA